MIRVVRSHPAYLSRRGIFFTPNGKLLNFSDDEITSDEAERYIKALVKLLKRRARK